MEEDNHDQDATTEAVPPVRRDVRIGAGEGTVNRKIDCPDCGHIFDRVVLHEGETTMRVCSNCGMNVRFANTETQLGDLSETLEADDE